MECIAATFELSLAPTSAAPARARAAVCDWLAQGPLDGLSEDIVRLLVSELVSNCVQHAGVDAQSRLRLRAWRRATTLHLEVRDAGTGGTVAPRTPRFDQGARGFGLSLVAQLSSDWGVDRDAQGTTVWLELDTAPHGAAQPQ
jgi:anti-sigma regulatory factor (Ser/Thr protein kinase)